jgi:glutathione S-transferase
VASSLYYAQQKGPAKRRANDFVTHRMPKFLGYFERVLARSGGPWMTGTRLGYVDLSMAQVVAGLRYAFPKASRRTLAPCPRLRELTERVFARPRIRRYAASGRRVAFNNDDIFRRYPELDA